MATKKAGHGAKVYVDHDEDLTYTKIDNVVKITPPTPTRDEVDMTVLESTVMEPDPADPPDMGEFSFDFNWHPTDTNHELLDTLFNSGAKVPWRVEFPFATPVTDTFTGWVKNLTPGDLESKTAIRRTCTVRVTSAITRA